MASLIVGNVPAAPGSISGSNRSRRSSWSDAKVTRPLLHPLIDITALIIRLESVECDRRYRCVLRLTQVNPQEARIVLSTRQTADSRLSKSHHWPFPEPSGDRREDRPCRGERVLCDDGLVATAMLL